MNSTEGKTTEEMLEQLHTKKCEQMQASGKLFDYLMDCQVYLKTQDLEGWKQQFQPAPTTQTKTIPKNKHSPNLKYHTPFDACLQCKSGMVIEDVPNGQIVCVQCGLIQSRVVSTEGAAHCSWDQILNSTRVSIHRYSKVGYMWTVLRWLQGESSPCITEDTLCRLQAEVDGVKTVDQVKKGLKNLGLVRKYTRHKWSLLRLLGGPQIYNFNPDTVFSIIKMFRRIEYYSKYNKSIFKCRSFFSYTVLIYIFLQELNLPAPQSLLLKDPKLNDLQFRMYEELQKSIQSVEPKKK